jgi:D-alanyl-D-alanine carboxypeptidase
MVVAALPPFHAHAARVTAAELGASWRPGCPVGPAGLRRLTVSYVGFDGDVHRGTLVVNRAVTRDVTEVFRRLYAARFPIRRMQPVARYGGSDTRSMAADNTSAFNCRYAVAPGPRRWSVHAYGEAVDVNTVENPYLEGGRVLPPAGRAYVERAPYRKGMAVPGGVLVRAFASVGWLWGGRWAGSPDWQHFSKTGG